MINRKLSLMLALMFLAACVKTDESPTQVGHYESSTSCGFPNVTDRVFFRTDSAVLSPDATKTLDQQVAFLAAYEGLVLNIEGHADERGTREYNLALGERRAKAVRDYLVSKGVAPHRLQTISYGKDNPTCTESIESCYSQNRRAVSSIQGGDS